MTENFAPNYVQCVRSVLEHHVVVSTVLHANSSGVVLSNENWLGNLDSNQD